MDKEHLCIKQVLVIIRVVELDLAIHVHVTLIVAINQSCSWHCQGVFRMDEDVEEQEVEVIGRVGKFDFTIGVEVASPHGSVTIFHIFVL